MYCLRWWIPLFLLPFSRSTPAFLVLFLISYAVHTKPCIYCTVILTGLFATSAFWYPSDTVDSDVHKSYGWLDLGIFGGNGFWSPLDRPSAFPSAVSPGTGTTDPNVLLTVPIPTALSSWTRWPAAVSIPSRFFLGLSKRRAMGVWINLA